MKSGQFLAVFLAHLAQGDHSTAQWIESVSGDDTLKRTPRLRAIIRSKVSAMSRAFFLAVGLFVMFLGVQTLGIQRFVLKGHEPTAAGQDIAARNSPASNRVLEPPPWAPWSLMATGAVVSLYAVTLPIPRK